MVWVKVRISASFKVGDSVKVRVWVRVSKDLDLG